MVGVVLVKNLKIVLTIKLRNRLCIILEQVFLKNLERFVLSKCNLKEKVLVECEKVKKGASTRWKFFCPQLYSQHVIIILVGNKRWVKEYTNGY